MKKNSDQSKPCKSPTPGRVQNNEGYSRRDPRPGETRGYVPNIQTVISSEPPKNPDNKPKNK